MRNATALRFVIRHSSFVILLLFAFVLRIYHLGAQSIWFDEGWSWHLANLPLAEMATTTAGDRSPVLYYGLLHFWLQLAGQSEFAMRYLSLMADEVTVALVICMARLLGSGKGEGGKGRRGDFTPSPFHPFTPSLLAGLLYTLCPFAVFYAQEARMYAQVAMFCTAASYALLRWVCFAPGLRQNKWLVASAACLALAIHSHYYAVFLLPAHAVIVLATMRSVRRFIAWCVAAAAVVLSVLPWLLFARGGFAYDDGFYFPLNTIGGRMLEWVRAFASGGFGFVSPEGWGWLLCIAALLGVIGFVLARRGRELLWLAALVILPLLAATLAVRVVYPFRSVFHPRYLIFVAPMACVLLASTSTKKRITKWFCFLPFVFCLSLWLPALQSYFTQPNLIRDDYRGATQHVVEALEPGDVVVMSRDNYAISYYWPADKANVLVAAPKGLHGVLKQAGLNTLVAQLQTKSPNRVRMMLWQENVVDPQKLAESLFWANGYQIGEYSFGQIRLPLFQVQRQPIQPLAFTSTQATFGATLALKSFWMRRAAWAGDLFYLVLEWQPTQPLPKDYKVFVHVLDQSGQLKFQKDKLAIDDLRPTSRWAVDETLRDPYSLVIPADLPVGKYRVVVGVYDPATGQRLPMQSQSPSPEPNAVELGILTVTAR